MRGHFAEDITGKRFGKLTVLSKAPSRADSSEHINAFWNCHCDCGNTVVVSGTRLRKGLVTSCGCDNPHKHLNPEDANIILCFARCNMHPVEVANLLNYTHPTIHYKLTRIYEKSGLNPRNFYDLIELVSIAEKLLKEERA